MGNVECPDIDQRAESDADVDGDPDSDHSADGVDRTTAS
jgi:hypothetical protein